MWDGFFGVQAAPANLAGVLPWIHWRAFSIIALIVFGNVFCFACPFVFVRDGARKLLPARLRWPRALRTKWLPVALLVLYFWAMKRLACGTHRYLRRGSSSATLWPPSSSMDSFVAPASVSTFVRLGSSIL